MKKIVVDSLFLFGLAAVMLGMFTVLPSNDFIAFSYLPALIAYWVGQLVQRKYGEADEK